MVSIPLGKTETINFVWDTLGKEGPHTITATVDPDNTINELDETNNSKSINVFVNPSQLGLEVNTDKPAYTAYETLTATIVITNLGTQTRLVGLTVEILDNNWQIKDITLKPQEKQLKTILWNTGNTYAGEYKVVARLKENSKLKTIWDSTSNNSLFFCIH